MDAPGKYTFDESAWPIVCVTSPLVPADDEGFHALLDWYSGLLLRRRLFVLLFELGHGASSVARRDELRRHSAKHQALIAAHQRGVGIVATSAYQRAVARALIWLVTPPCPAAVFADWEAALRWATEQLPIPTAASHPELVSLE